MEENKLLSYTQLRDKVLTEVKKYFQIPKLHKPNFEIRISEEKDNFQTTVDMVFIHDLNHPEKKVPTYDLMVIYENYIRCQDVEKVIRMLATTMERQYPQEEELKREDKPEFHITTMVVEGDGEINNVYLLTEDKLQYSTEEIMKEDDALIPIAEKEKSNLQMVPYGENAVLAIPLNTLEEYTDNLEVLAELYQLELEQEKELESQVYDRSRNVLIKDPEEIKELLIKGNVKKKGVFSR